LLSLAQAARRFPPYRLGRPVSPSTIWRWINDGVELPDGSIVRLDGVRVAGRWLTSAEAIVRFIEAQMPDLDKPRSPLPTPTKRKKAAEKAGKRLEKLGI